MNFGYLLLNISNFLVDPNRLMGLLTSSPFSSIAVTPFIFTTYLYIYNINVFLFFLLLFGVSCIFVLFYFLFIHTLFRFQHCFNFSFNTNKYTHKIKNTLWWKLMSASPWMIMVIVTLILKKKETKKNIINIFGETCTVYRYTHGYHLCALNTIYFQVVELLQHEKREKNHRSKNTQIFFVFFYIHGG